jgi:hypothetical protein
MFTVPWCNVRPKQTAWRQVAFAASGGPGCFLTLAFRLLPFLFGSPSV